MPFLERIWWPQEGEREEQQEEKTKKALSMVSCDIVCCDTVVGIMPCHEGHRVSMKRIVSKRGCCLRPRYDSVNLI